jgi:hypothetical protein
MCMTQPPPDMPDYVPPCKVAVFDVAEAGRYRVSLLASPGATVKGRVIVSEVVSGRLDPGKPVKLASMKPAQAARFTFEGKSGDKLSVSLNGIATTPRNSTVTLTLEQVEGGRFNRTITGTRARITMPTADLHSSGKFAVIVDAGLAAIDSAELVVKEE